MTSSGTRTPAHSSYDAWSSLDPDLLVVVAKNCDATSVCRLLQACKAWRDAVATNSSSIWEPLVSKRFPRSVDILKALPPLPKHSFAEHYREQLKAESSNMEHPKPLIVTTQLSDFIFTAELVSASGSRRIVDQWTGNVSGLARHEPGGNFVLPIDWRPWHKTWDYPNPCWPPASDNDMRLELFVSRALNGRVRTRMLYASKTFPEDVFDGTYYFYSTHWQPPVKSLYLTDDFRGDDTLKPVVHLELFEHDPDEPTTVWVEFRLDSDYESTGMTVRQLLEYLEHGVDWE